MTIDNECFSFKKLLWDTENFNINTYELFLKKDLHEKHIQELNFIFGIKGLIYIKNATQNRNNSKFIGLNFDAVLYDTNIFFKFNISNNEKFHSSEYNYKISSAFAMDIENFAIYEYSRFYKDTELRERSNKNIYSEWINNAQSIGSKKFLTIESQNTVTGYVLYQANPSEYTIELISTNKEYQNMKLGTILIECLKKEALNNSVSKIFVGTQISNVRAINLYIKNGFNVVSTTDIYHWWNT